jgi:hypothetical protein
VARPGILPRFEENGPKAKPWGGIPNLPAYGSPKIDNKKGRENRSPFQVDYKATDQCIPVI